MLTVVSLPLGETRPATGLDPSWRVGLSLAHVQGLHFGHDITFTYGPLGFLAYPQEVWFPGVVLGVVYAVVTTLVFHAALCVVILRWLPAPAAVAATAAVSFFVPAVRVEDLGSFAVLLFGILLVQPERVGTPVARWVPSVLGAVAALELQVKFGVGVFCCAVTAIVVVARCGRVRSAGIAMASFVAAFVTLWLVGGQHLGDIVNWIRVSMAISSGYSDAMAIVGKGFDRSSLVVVIAPAGLLAAWMVVELRSHKAKYLPVLVLVAGGCWYLAKEGFVRLDFRDHRNIAFFGFAAVVLALPWRRWWRPLALGVALVCLGTLVVDNHGETSDLRVIAQRHFGGTADALRLAKLAFDGDGRARRLAKLRHAVLDAYGIGPEVLQELEGSVHADPWDVAAVWASGHPWQPIPALQSYGVYADVLDEAAVRHLLGPDAPDSILVSSVAGAIDGRYEPWDAPGYHLARTCVYDAVAVDDTWRVLHRRRENRCGEPVLIAEQKLQRGQTGKVPQPRSDASIVVARIEYPVGAIDALATAVLKPLELSSVVVDGVRYRFLSGVADRPHLLHVPALASLPDSGLDIHTVMFPDGSGTVVVRYYEIPLE